MKNKKGFDKEFNIVDEREALNNLFGLYDRKIKDYQLGEKYFLDGKKKDSIEKGILFHYIKNVELSNLPVGNMDIIYATCMIPYVIEEKKIFGEIDNVLKKKFFLASVSINTILLKKYMKKTIKQHWVQHIYEQIVMSFGKLDVPAHYTLGMNGFYFSFRTSSYTQIKWHMIIDKICRVIGNYIIPKLTQNFN